MPLLQHHSIRAHFDEPEAFERNVTVRDLLALYAAAPFTRTMQQISADPTAQPAHDNNMPVCVSV